MLYVNEPITDSAVGLQASCWGYLLLTIVKSRDKIFAASISERHADIWSVRSVHVKACHVKADEQE